MKFSVLASVLIGVSVVAGPIFVSAAHPNGERAFTSFRDDANCASGFKDEKGNGVTFSFVSPDCFVPKKDISDLGFLESASCKVILGARWATTDSSPASSTAKGVCYMVVAGIGHIGGALGLINQIVNWLVVFLIVFGTFYGIWGAYEFLGSGGEDKKLTAGKKKIYYAVGGVALGLLVKGIIALLVSFVGGLGG